MSCHVDNMSVIIALYFFYHIGDLNHVKILLSSGYFKKSVQLHIFYFVNVNLPPFSILILLVRHVTKLLVCKSSEITSSFAIRYIWNRPYAIYFKMSACSKRGLKVSLWIINVTHNRKSIKKFPCFMPFRISVKIDFVLLVVCWWYFIFSCRKIIVQIVYTFKESFLNILRWFEDFCWPSPPSPSVYRRSN